MRPNATHTSAAKAVLRNATSSLPSLKSLQSLKALQHLKNLQKLRSSAHVSTWQAVAIAAAVIGVLVVAGCCLCRLCGSRARLRATHATAGSDRPLLVRGDVSMSSNLLLANLSSLGHGSRQRGPDYEPIR